MEHSLKLFTDVVRRYDCKATLPITAVTLKRYSDVIKKYQTEEIEFAIHGYTHNDLFSLNQMDLESQLEKAVSSFNHEGISPRGFRSPYLRQNKFLYSALEKAGFLYLSNQPFLWQVLVEDDFPVSRMKLYRDVLAYYEPWNSTERLSLPRLINNIVEIPVSLPDDEILVDRLRASPDFVLKTWCSILHRSNQRGELFTLQLHPERAPAVADCLGSLLATALTLRPKVWCASLAEIATWWKERTAARVEISSHSERQYHFSSKAPKNAIILARGVDVKSTVQPFSSGYQEIKASNFTLESPVRPIIGISSYSSKKLEDFLKQQGYIIEISQDKELYSYFFNMPQFDLTQEKSVLELLEQTDRPLVRFGRWPDGAQSALAITGDIDVMTIWDYGLRLFGK
jgi:hypothetical protein